MHLRRADLEALVDFLGDVAALEVDEAYSLDALRRFDGLIRYDGIQYQEYDYRVRRYSLTIGVWPEGAGREELCPAEPATEDEELYWRLGPCEIMLYRAREQHLEAVRMSDVVTRARYRESPIYRDYFRPLGDMEHMLDLGLHDPAGRQRSLLLTRGDGLGDFSDRDRAVLELLRPHLYQLERHAALRRRMQDMLRRHDPANGDGDAYAGLTRREREIVELVGQGKTNAEIAAELWVAPSTVKKHLEHVYGKLGVGRRAALAAALPTRSRG